MSSCLVGRVTDTETRDIAHMSTVVSREGMIHLPSEKGPVNQRMPGMRTRLSSSSHAQREPLLPQQLGQQELSNATTPSSPKSQKQDDTNYKNYKSEKFYNWKGTTYDDKGLPIARATPLERISITMQSKTMQIYTTTSCEGSSYNHTTKFCGLVKPTIVGEHKANQHNSLKAYGWELNAQTEKFTATTTRWDVQFCLGTISNLCFAPDVNSGLGLWGGCKGY